MSGILLNEAGGEHVEDLNVLGKDDGFGRLLMRLGDAGMSRQQQRALQRRWRKLKERKRAVPSPSAMFRYLEKFHDPHQETLRKKFLEESDKKAFIPAPNECLQGFSNVNADLVAWSLEQQPEKLVTLDLDATLIKTTKAAALYGYKGFQCYQPLNVWLAEHNLMLYSEFRDGNVPAGFEILRVFIESLEFLPNGVTKVRVRSDTAAYQHDFLKYMAMGKNKRFGVIEFVIGCDVTDAFKEAVAQVNEDEWKPITRFKKDHFEPTGHEYAEVCFVPNGMGFSKKGPLYRYVAIREPMEEQGLPGLEEQQKLPFPTIRLQKKRYKLFGVVTNIADPENPMGNGKGWNGEKVVKFYRKRCGKSEEAHAVLKSDLAGGTLPSADFGENAAWWWMATLAMNLNTLLKRHVLQGDWEDRRMKALRYGLIRIAGRVIEHARRLIIRISGDHPAYRLLLEARERIAELALPAG